MFTIRYWHLRGIVAASAFASMLCCVAADLPKNAADLYRLTNIWSIHLKFDPAEWNAIEPKGGGGFPGFGGGPGRGPGGPGGPGGFRGGGPGGPPPIGMMLTPAFVRDGDLDKDSKISKDEFAKLGAKWFADWDKDKAGKVNNEQLVAGLNGMIMRGFGGPGGLGGGPGFGPPGGRGGGMGMALQGPEGGRNGIAARMGVEFNYVHGNLDLAGATFSNVAVRYKGNGTYLQARNTDKKSLKVDLNKFVKGQKVAGLTTLNLHNGVTDPSYMNEALSFKLYRDAGVPAPRTACSCHRGRRTQK